MGTVLSFSPREKNPPYAVVDYGSVGGGAANGVGAGGHPFNNNKQEIVGNGVMASAAKSNEKSAKKHSMFLNALNWKKFSSASIPPSSSKSNKKQQQQQQQTAADKAATAAAMASRQFHAGKGFPQVRKRSSLCLWSFKMYSYMFPFPTSDAEPGERAPHPGRRPQHGKRALPWHKGDKGKRNLPQPETAG